MFQDVRVIAAQYYMYLLVAATYLEFTRYVQKYAINWLNYQQFHNVKKCLVV